MFCLVDGSRILSRCYPQWRSNKLRLGWTRAKRVSVTSPALKYSGNSGASLSWEHGTSYSTDALCPRKLIFWAFHHPFFGIPNYDPQLCMKKRVAVQCSATLHVQCRNHVNRPRFAERTHDMEMEACMTDNWSSKATLVSIQNRLLYNALGVIDGDRLRYDRLCSNMFAPFCFP